MQSINQCSTSSKLICRVQVTCQTRYPFSTQPRSVMPMLPDPLFKTPSQDHGSVRCGVLIYMTLLSPLFSLSRSISSTNIIFIHPLVYSVSSSSYFLSLLIDQTSTNHHSPARRHPIKRKRRYSMFPSLIPVLSSTNKMPEELWTHRPIPHILGER